MDGSHALLSLKRKLVSAHSKYVCVVSNSFILIFVRGFNRGGRRNRDRPSLRAVLGFFSRQSGNSSVSEQGCIKHTGTCYIVQLRTCTSKYIYMTVPGPSLSISAGRGTEQSEKVIHLQGISRSITLKVQLYCAGSVNCGRVSRIKDSASS